MIFYQVFSYTVGILGIILNASLLYFAIFKSPRGLKTYSIIIINLAMTDLLASFCTILVEPRMITINYSSIIVNYGICVNFGARWCFYGYVLTLHLFLHSQFLLFYSFCYRLYSLKCGTLSERKVVLSIAIIYIPSLLQFILQIFSIGDQGVLYRLLINSFPSYHTSITRRMITGVEDFDEPSTALATSILIICPILIYTSVIVLRRKIITTLDEKMRHLRHETKVMNHQLLKVLTFQAFLPMILILSLFVYLIDSIEIYRFSLVQYSIIATFEIFPVLTPMIYLYYVTPYYRSIRKLFDFKTQERSVVLKMGGRSTLATVT